MTATLVRSMRAEDWPRVAEIFLAWIHSGIATFHTDCPSYAQWDAGHFQVPRLVAEQGDEILGWIALGPISARPVYRGVGEVSIYLDEAAQGRGVGRLLLMAMIGEAAEAGFWTLQSGIFRDNARSIALHEACGFRMIGYRERIGQDITGRWRDTVLMENRL